jgi:hypothetical protein
MKPFLILIFVVFLNSFNANAQTNIETNPILTEVVLNVDALSIDSENQVAGKKRDILNAKINSKLKGEVDLFLVTDKSKIC